MSDDPIRDMVKRARDLRVDVERLKSGQRSEGVLRVIRQVDEQLGFTDAVDARLQDRFAEDQLGFADAVTARLQDALASEQVGFDDAVTTTVETGGEFVADQSVADGSDDVG